jgi:cation transport regulator ChaC
MDTEININNEEIEQVKCTTFLGIIIDECLTRKDHINKIAKLITKASGIIAKIRHYMSRNALKLIY